MRREVSQPLDEQGRLREALLPAVYFETSVIVDYWSAEGIESSRAIPERDPAKLGGEYEAATRDLFKYTKQLDKMADVRELLQFGNSAYTAVTSPLAILELAEWYAHASFKQIASQAAGIVSVNRLSRKEVGDLLKKIYREGTKEMEEIEDHYSVNMAPKAAILNDCLLNMSFLEFHGLNGILDIDIKGLSIDAAGFFNKAAMLAYQQVGLADVMHLAAASHLGCSHFASFDSDFARCRELIAEQFGLSLVVSADELTSLLRRSA